MIEYLNQLDTWLEREEPFASVTVASTWGSAPRPIGTMMFIGNDMDMLGSVSGGCVEGTVVREAAEVMSSGKPKFLRFGVTDDDAWSVGLTCGGTIEVFLERFIGFDDAEIWQQLRGCLSNNESAVLMTRMNDTLPKRVLITQPTAANPAVFPDSAPQALVAVAQEAYRTRKSQVVEVSGEKWLVRVFAHKPQLFVVGAAHASAEVVHLAHWMGFETIVIDPRGIFAQKTHFTTQPDQMFEEYPAEILPDYALDEYSFGIVMAHDPKIDDQALHLFLRSKIAYIGALSSKQSNEKRRERLLAAGFTEGDMARIHAPVGLPIKSKTAREIALSVVAEMVKVKNQYL
jgi:xanthine dehydrogenase accessory factor